MTLIRCEFIRTVGTLQIKSILYGCESTEIHGTLSAFRKFCPNLRDLKHLQAYSESYPQKFQFTAILFSFGMCLRILFRFLAVPTYRFRESARNAGK